jgi:hypothetical protein
MTLIPKAKKDLNSLTVLEKEKEVSRLFHETEELIDELGQESDKSALRTVQEYGKEIAAETQLEQEIDIETLKKYSTNKLHYQRYLVAVLHRFVAEEKISKRFSLYVESNDEGIVLGIEHTEYVGAFKPSGMPFYDINACKILAVQLGNTIARLEGNFETTDSGIILASKQDLEIITKHGNNNKPRT